MKNIDSAALLEALRQDGEFLRAARLWSGSFAFSDRATQLLVSVEGGHPVSAELTEPGTPADVTFTGPADGWVKVFAAVPPPFYQDLIGGAVGRQGFTVSGDLTTMSAYYGAIQRAVGLAGAVLRSGAVT